MTASCSQFCSVTACHVKASLHFCFETTSQCVFTDVSVSATCKALVLGRVVGLILHLTVLLKPVCLIYGSLRIL